MPAAAVNAATFALVKNPSNPLQRCIYSVIRIEYSECLEKICSRSGKSLHSPKTLSKNLTLDLFCKTLIT